jgi:hypothetical protein
VTFGFGNQHSIQLSYGRTGAIIGGGKRRTFARYNSKLTKISLYAPQLRPPLVGIDADNIEFDHERRTRQSD